MRTIIIIVVAAIALFFLVAWYTDQNADNQLDNDSRTATTTPEITWELYETTVGGELDVSLQYPSNVAVRRVQDTIYEIVYVGPNSEPNTEITDGYYISMQFLSEDYAEVLEAAEPIGAVAPVNFNGYDAQTYMAESELGPAVAHTLVDIEPYILDITVSVTGENALTYQNEVDAILDSMAFDWEMTAVVPDDVQAQIDAMSDQITVEEPTPMSSVSSPIQLRGEAWGPWFFEASAPVVITNWNGLIIGEGYITAEGDWMTEDFVPFSGEVSYTREANSAYASGTIIFQKSNASGLPENDAAVEIPIILE